VYCVLLVKLKVRLCVVKASYW